MNRLLIVSNRLPISVTVVQGRMQIRRSAGGLATGLRGPHERSGGLWIGWPGDTHALSDEQQATLQRQLTDMRAVPVELTAEEVEEFYGGFSNGALWPLFHYLLDQVPLHVRNWDAYERVNERFADAVASHHQPGDLVWVHDYQLMLVPQLVRQRVPEARVGFFLHIPFPTSEVFRTFPFRARLLEGLLGADLIGFHTAAYMRHFASSLLRTLGVAADVDRVRWTNREVRLGVFPMGIDAERFVSLADQADTARQVQSIRGSDGCAVLVGIDRLDYTKGIPRRLLAIEQLLLTHPTLRERVRLIQVAVPSRTGVEAYADFRRQVDGLIGRINGAFGTTTWVPVHYIYRGLSEQEIVALYRSADVMLVTPIRDGMNLVAKEFIASRTDGDGVLVLSEFAGAASELAEAVFVNPYDVDETADACYRALRLPETERRTRMRALRRRVLSYDVHRWVQSFIDTLGEASATRHRAEIALATPAQRATLVARMRVAPHLLLLLDYDGTLVPFAGVPELATPDEALLELLGRLAARAHTEVHIISGRSRDTMTGWFGTLPIALHAEHGFWSRRAGGDWIGRPTPRTEWRQRVLAILEHFAARTPGSLIEEKTASVAWHYRMAEPDFGALQAKELRLHLTELLSNAPVEILPGEKVIEVRAYGINKGTVVAPLLATAAPGTLTVAFGDDRTDEDLFAALPEDAVAVHVGPQPSRAQVRLASVDDARALLAAVLAPS